MVFVNSKKYACESCIKGHRSSSCHHNDRPLFEIKKKGRPVSQCEKCREARQSRRIHAKCNCDAEKCASVPDSSASSSSTTAKKGKRFIPTIPSLPNGLKDALKSSGPVHEDSGESRQSVDVLLNPCHCRDVWNCKCRSQVSAGRSASRPSPPPPISSSVFNNGLSALAHVAACCSPAPPPRFFTEEARQAATAGPPERTSARTARPDCPHPHPKKPAARTTKADRVGSLQQIQSMASQAGPSSFRPIRASALSIETGPSSSTLPLPTTSIPKFPISATCSTSTTSSSMTSNCGCGQNCVCAGCAMHSTDTAPGSPTTGKSVPVHRGNCAHDCPTCVDHDGGVELPGHKPQSTFLDQFFARAAALPSPPMAGRIRSTSLDPTNLTVYPPSLLSASESERDVRGLAFGLVNVPKLECCGGKCSCPENTCSCGTECNGCCADDEKEEGYSLGTPKHGNVSPLTSFARGGVVKKSCCS